MLSCDLEHTFVSQSKQLMSTPRLRIPQAAAEAFKAMLDLERFLNASSLDKKLLELVKIRASQINRCAYCLNMHTRDAIKIGESSQRIFLLEAWRETTLYTPQERAALELTEQLTLIAHHEITDTLYTRLLTLFGEKDLATLIMAVAVINTWNRIAISTQLPIED